MRPARVAQLGAVLVLVASGLYVLVYLYRWEWNRAVIAGVFFLTAEVALGLGLVLERLRRLEERIDRAGQRDVLARVVESSPPARDHFQWLRPKDSPTSVFVPVLMGAGAIASGLAWLVERLARATAKPALERGLALRLSPLAWPQRGLTDPGPPDPGDLLRGPMPRS